MKSRLSGPTSPSLRVLHLTEPTGVGTTMSVRLVHDCLPTERVVYFNTVYRKYYTDVYRYALWRTGNIPDAEDIAVTTFTFVWARLEDLPEEKQVKHHLLEVARRAASNFWRAHARLCKHEALRSTIGGESALGRDEIDSLFSDLLPANKPVAEAMGALRPTDQLVLRLIYWDGLSRAQAAATLGCSLNALNLRLSRARKAIRYTLVDGAGEPHTDPNKPRGRGLDLP